MPLKEIREKKKLTQNELAKKTGITTQAISNYENYTRNPTYEVLNKLVKALKLNSKEELELRRSFGKSS